jgi:hypothetical protein
MSEPPGAQSAEPESPQAAQDRTPPASPIGERPKWKKFLSSIILGGIGLLLLLFAVLLYTPAPSEPSNPGLPRLNIFTDASVGDIYYKVTRTTASEAQLKIMLFANPGPASWATVELLPPDGTAILERTAPFEPATDARSATVEFFESAVDLGVVFDGVNASVAIPIVFFGGAGNPQMLVEFDIPSASSYDWSSFPTSGTTSNKAWWLINLSNYNTTQGRVVVSTDYARQASDTDRTFFAGALLGLAGAAILAGIQELLHTN